MVESHYFVVRGSQKRRQFAIEVGLHKQTEHQLRKPHEHGQAIIYMCEIPQAMTLKEAVTLYLNGVKAKPKMLAADKKPLATVLADKRDRRERARLERAKTGK